MKLSMFLKRPNRTSMPLQRCRSGRTSKRTRSWQRARRRAARPPPALCLIRRTALSLKLGVDKLSSERAVPTCGRFVQRHGSEDASEAEQGRSETCSDSRDELDGDWCSRRSCRRLSSDPPLVQLALRRQAHRPADVCRGLFGPDRSRIARLLHSGTPRDEGRPHCGLEICSGPQGVRPRISIFKGAI